MSHGEDTATRHRAHPLLMRNFIPAIGAVLALGLAARQHRDRRPGGAAQASVLRSSSIRCASRCVAAKCVQVTVAENPQLPAGRQISLHVALVPAINRDKRPDPLFVLAGGPGMAAGAFYAESASAFARIHRDRDIVLVDQRGTGMSHPLNCALTEEELYNEDDAQLTAQTQRCLTALSPHADVRSTRRVLRCRTWSRCAPRSATRSWICTACPTARASRSITCGAFPSARARVMLDGVVPPQIALGAAAAQDAEERARRCLCALHAGCRVPRALRRSGRDLPAAAHAARRARRAGQPGRPHDR